MIIDLVGRILVSYRVEELFGVGGMGRVYRAVHQRLQAQRAIKALHENYSANPNICATFLREAQTLASLRHNNIVTIYDCGEQDGLRYIVTELVNGGSLRQLFSHPENAQQPCLIAWC